MSLVGDHLWQASVTFTGSGDGNGGQRFKFDVKGDWTQNYGDTNRDGVAETGRGRHHHGGGRCLCGALQRPDPGPTA